ncbi:glycosyltransferase family 2 protein [Actibacterium lipolyticum]|uniref:Glycosyl transferase family 2 n=1 Tax=Actibacterium lipolyticum TaxID=1524263 RepID=A0A238KVN6_9RHOB|nr:glycosyltransferase family 2 protein [Actibacterium lipolyticum]SMX46839.1 hypothetical protein COL8621_03264 [Actibacterium lipolyticum]
MKRKQLLFRAFRKRREMTPVANRTASIAKGDILLFATIRNEEVRLPYFLKYYRNLGVDHFLIVDNGSEDGGRALLEGQPDVSLWSCDKSYKKSRYGADWLNWLQRKYGHDHWSLVVDVDEFFVYPFCDSRPIRALTDWLDNSGRRSFSAMLLDMYPRGPLDLVPYKAGQNPFEIAEWFDSGNYTMKKNNFLGNLWIQGGPRAREYFSDNPASSPALNKIPLVKWHRSYAYVSSTHMLLPRGLNLAYDEWGGEKASGCLLHAKFINTLASKSQEELLRKQHFADGKEYKAYYAGLKEDTGLWSKWSEQYINWRQLEILGLMSKGNWA